MNPRTITWLRIALGALILPAGVAIWGGWVGLGRLAGWGPVTLLPGILDGCQVTLTSTLPVSVEAYAALALGVWLARDTPARARRFARVSALAAMALGSAGQVAYHMLVASGATEAPTAIVILVAVLPVGTLTAAAALLHMMQDESDTETLPRSDENARAVLAPAPATVPTKRVHVQRAIDLHPSASSTAIARLVGCSPSYVRDVRRTTPTTVGEAA